MGGPDGQTAEGQGTGWKCRGRSNCSWLRLRWVLHHQAREAEAELEESVVAFAVAVEAEEIPSGGYGSDSHRSTTLLDESLVASATTLAAARFFWSPTETL